MREFEFEGTPVIHYAGSGKAIFRDGSEAVVSVEVVQVTDGRIVVNCTMPPGSTELDRFDLSEVELPLEDGAFLRTQGSKTEEKVSMWVDDPFYQFRAGRVRIEYPDYRFEDVRSVQVAMANLPFSISLTSFPENIPPFDVAGLRVAFHQSEDYDVRAKRLKQVGGYEITGYMNITWSREDTVGPSQIERFLRECCTGLSLAVSTKVNWLYYTARNDKEEQLVTIHSAEPLLPFSSIPFSFPLWNEPVEVVKAWCNPSLERVIPRQKLVSRIDQYISACDTTTFGENKGLAVATLLDVLSYVYADEKGLAEIVPEALWRQHVLPHVQEALQLTMGVLVAEKDMLVTIGPEQQKALVNNLQGLFRSSFRQRLTAILKDLGIETNGAFRDEIVRTRDELVHCGHFRNETDNDWQAELRRLLWAARSILLRMVGYQGELPHYKTIEEINKW